MLQADCNRRWTQSDGTPLRTAGGVHNGRQAAGQYGGRSGRWSGESRLSLVGESGHHDPVTESTETVVLWRPTGPEDLALVEASGWREWPPRLHEQPIFYPVLNEEYAAKIARDWNVPASGSGYVTRFEVRKSFLDHYQVRQAGGQSILEYWIPAEDLPTLNANIVGQIELVAEYH
jgi:hypothetical protein